MPILLKDLLKEAEEKDPNENPLKVQIYCDMDGVLVDMEGEYDQANPSNSHGFKKLSKGLSPLEYEAKYGKNSFWKLIGQDPNFWINLKPLENAVPLWTFIKFNFRDFYPIILTAGQGSNLAQQKTAWIRKYIDPTAQVIIAPKGEEKPNYIKPYPGQYVSHILIDDTPKNIKVWNNPSLHRIAIEYKDENYDSAKAQLEAYIKK